MPMTTQRPPKAALLLAVLVAVAVAGCDAVQVGPRGNSAAESAALEQTFATLERFQVSYFRDESSCLAFIYSRGTFVGPRTPDGCGPIAGERKAFDEEATGDFEELKRVLAHTGVAVRYGSATYGDEQRVTSAMFEIGCTSPCAYGSYQYQRGGITIDPGLEGPNVSMTRLSADWMWYEEN